jgi:hypothetical protein
MNTTLNTNGRQRKTLAAQIDRLDAMLDGLADGLNEAVAQAVKDAVALAVEEAVRVVLSETLTNPAVLAKLHATISPAQTPAPVPTPTTNDEPPPPPAAGLGSRLASFGNWLGRRLKNVGTQAFTVCQRLYATIKASAGRVALTGTLAVVVIKEKVLQAGACFRPLWRRKYQIGAALVVCLALGAAGHFAGPYLAVAAGIVCGFVVALAVQVGLWFRNLVTFDELTWEPIPGFAQ